MAMTIIYDRNFRREEERNYEWNVGELLPNIAPHRIIELHLGGKEKEVLEEIMGQMSTNDHIRLYGDLARTAWINLEAEYGD